MIMRYPVVIHKEEGTDYGVTVPDLPGCFSAGGSLDEALEMAAEAIELHLEGLALDGETAPPPRTIETHQNNPDYADGVWAVVAVDADFSFAANDPLASKGQPIHISLPEKLVESMDEYAMRQGKTRAKVIAEATIAYAAAQDF